MATAKPLRNNNAIEAMAFVVQLNRPIQADEAAKLFSLKGEIEKILPRFEMMQGHTMMVGGPSLLQQSTPNGISAQSFKGDGTPMWMLRAFTNVVIVNCFEYDTWANVWDRAKGLLTQSLRAIASASLNISGVGLQVVDRFVYDSDPTPYALADVFQADSVYLPPNVARAGAHWQVSQNWPLSLVADGKTPESDAFFDGAGVANTLTLRSGRINDNFSVSVDHLVQITLEGMFPDVFHSPEDEDRSAAFLDEAFSNVLRISNKSVIRELLCDEQLKAIGMGDRDEI